MAEALDRRTLVYIFHEVANMQMKNYEHYGGFFTDDGKGKNIAYMEVMELLNIEMAKEKAQFNSLV